MVDVKGKMAGACLAKSRTKHKGHDESLKGRKEPGTGSAFNLFERLGATNGGKTSADLSGCLLDTHRNDKLGRRTKKEWTCGVGTELAKDKAKPCGRSRKPQSGVKGKAASSPLTPLGTGRRTLQNSNAFRARREFLGPRRGADN